MEADFYSDMETAGKVMQKLKGLKDKVSRYEALSSSREDLLTLIEIAEEESDESVLDEVKQGYKQLTESIESMKLETLLSGKYDKSSAIITLHAGAGGTEAQDWCEMLFRMFNRWAERKGYKTETLDLLDGEEAGIKSVTFSVEGLNAYGYLRSEKGVHRLVRISPFDSAARRHTSFASVEVMPELDDDIDVQINPEDLRVDTYRSSGAGGQHVNKTESAIRITHIPTGIVVACQDERSQHKNREAAMKMLRSRLYDKMEQERNASIAADRKSQVGTGDRSERIRTYNFPQGRMTDHRIGLTLYKLEQIMNGDLDETIDALITTDQSEKLKAHAE